MNILITGASGFIASALIPELKKDGHEIIPLRRSGSGASGPGQAAWLPEQGTIDLHHAGNLDAVIHLAGENIAQRWTPEAKNRIYRSRVHSTGVLCQTLATLAHPPRVLLCASAIGYYGDRGADLVDESSPPGRGFLAELVRNWEAAATPAATAGMRVVSLRLGVVISSQGGALAKMLPAFRLGLGGKLGNGRQYWSWIALEDLVAVVRHSLRTEALRGPVNVVSPRPATNAEFTQALGHVLHRPTFCTVPAVVLKLLFGEMGREALLSSCRVAPNRLLQTGFQFQWPDLAPALKHYLAPAAELS